MDHFGISIELLQRLKTDDRKDALDAYVSRANRLYFGVRVNAGDFRALINQRAKQAGIVLEEQARPIPARARWISRSCDRLFELVVSDETDNFVAGERTQEILSTWRSLYGQTFNVIWGNGGYIAPRQDAGLDVVIFGTPNPSVQHRKTTRSKMRLGSHWVFASSYLTFSKVQGSINNSAQNTERLANTLYIRFPLKSSVMHDAFVANILESNEPSLSGMPSEARARVIKARLAAVQNIILQKDMAFLAHEESRLAQARKDEKDNLNIAGKQRDQIRAIQADVMRGLSEANLQSIAAQRFNQIKGFNKIVDMQFEDGCLAVRTVPLYVVHPQTNVRYSMGAYRIVFSKIGSINWQPCIINLTRTVADAHHPHIRQNYTCWGNIQSTLESLIRDNQYGAALSMIIAFLETVNPQDNWGKSIGDWPRAEERL